jgi:hypothetical protein
MLFTNLSALRGRYFSRIDARLLPSAADYAVLSSHLEINASGSSGGRPIEATARNAGLLDLRLVPERHSAVKVLLLLDVGGSSRPSYGKGSRTPQDDP